MLLSKLSISSLSGGEAERLLHTVDILPHVTFQFSSPTLESSAALSDLSYLRWLIDLDSRCCNWICMQKSALGKARIPVGGWKLGVSSLLRAVSGWLG